MSIVWIYKIWQFLKWFNKVENNDNYFVSNLSSMHFTSVSSFFKKIIPYMYIKYTYKQNSDQKEKIEMSKDMNFYNVAIDIYVILLW